MGIHTEGVGHIRNYDVTVSNGVTIPLLPYWWVSVRFYCVVTVQSTTVVDQFITISVLELLNGEMWCSSSVAISAFTATALILCRYNSGVSS